MLHGEQRGIFDLSFAIPAECADRLESGLADIGIVPAVELNRQKLEIICGAGIACHGPVRSIFLISKVPYGEIRKLAGKSQRQVAEALNIKQPSLSKLEKQSDMQISTLRRIVTVLGGELEIIAKFPNGAVKIEQFGETTRGSERERSAPGELPLF